MVWVAVLTAPLHHYSDVVLHCTTLQLMEALKKNTAVTSVDLTANHIKDEGVQVSPCASEQLAPPCAPRLTATLSYVVVGECSAAPGGH